MSRRQSWRSTRKGNDMSTKFTPGPFNARFDEAITVHEADGARICILGHLGKRGRRTTQEVTATARLLADAPAMYAMIEKLLAFNEPDSRLDQEGDFHLRLAADQAWSEAQALVSRHQS